MSHSAEIWFGKRYDQDSLRMLLGGNLGNIDDDVNQFKNTDKKWKRVIKDLDKKKKIYSMSKRIGSCRDLKNIRSKVSKNY